MGVSESGGLFLVMIIVVVAVTSIYDMIDNSRVMDTFKMRVREIDTSRVCNKGFCEVDNDCETRLKACTMTLSW